MKKYMMAIFLLHSMQQPLQAVYFGQGEAAILLLLFVGITKEYDAFYASESKKNMPIEQSKIFQDVVVHGEKSIIFHGTTEHENPLKKQNIILKSLCNRPLLKGSGIVQNPWQPLKKIKYSLEK